MCSMDIAHYFSINCHYVMGQYIYISNVEICWDLVVRNGLQYESVSVHR